MKKSWKVWLLGAIMLITGSANTLISKFQYNTEAHGLPDEKGETLRPFTHPWLQTMLMFVAETTCLYAFLTKLMCSDKDKKQRSGAESSKIQLDWTSQLLLIIPTMCDFISTVISSIGLLWVDPSVFQMLRGSLIIFVGILSRVFLKRTMTFEQWVGIASSGIGIGLVSLSSVLGRSTSQSDNFHVFLGISLILGSQLLSAVQMILEEKFLGNRKLEPLNVVGMEGVYGTIICSFALVVTYFLPGSSGPYAREEDTLDAFKQLSNSTPLVITTVMYIVSIAFFNFSGVSITHYLSATHRTLLDSCRTTVIWLVGIVLYYGFDLKNYGEPLDYWSITKVDGFALLIIGTVFYNVTGRRKPPVAVESEKDALLPSEEETESSL